MSMRVYVAAPYTHGDIGENMRRAIDAGMAILDSGDAPVVPHLSHFLHLQHPRPYETWIEMGLELLAGCDAVVRLSGFSPGAERETKRAAQLGIPVYLGVGEFLERRTCRRP